MDYFDHSLYSLIILDILTDFFVHVIRLSPKELLQVVYLCINKLAPTWEGLELGIGESLLVKAIGEATSRSVAHIKKDLQELGDLGAVAQASRSKQRTMFQPKALTVPAVFKVLKEIASFSGHSVNMLPVFLFINWAIVNEQKS
jgi:DNA ligase-1